MSDNESESSYNDGGDNDSSFAEEEVVAKPMGSSVKRKAAKRSPVVLELSNDDSSGSVPVKGTSKPIAVPAKRKALAKKKQTSKAPAKRKSIPKQKASPALESSDGFSSSSEENQVSAAKAKSVPAKRKPVPKKKVVLELSDDDDSDEAPKAAKKNPVVKRKASKPVAAAAEDSMSDDDSSYNSLELDVGAPKKKKSPKKIVLELSDDDSSDKKVAAKVKASAPGKVKRTTKEDGDDADDSSEIKPSRSPAKVAVAKKRKSVTKKVALEDYDAYDIVLPPNLVNASNGECTVLVQIDPDDVLDFTGAVGAVGRMEADDERVILDLKGTQYTGKIFPGPTALVLVVTNSTNGAADPYLKVEGITDEFCSLVKTGDAMAKMNAAVQDAMEDYYNYEDEDVNRTTKTDSAAVDTAEGTKADPKKRRRSSKAAAPKRKR